MTDQNKTAIMMIVDRSGSMRPLSQDVVGGFNQFVEEQKKEPGDATLTLVQFDHEYEVVYVNKPLSEVPSLVHQPRGGTALLDAVGRGIVELGEALAKEPEDKRPGKVIVVIMTDGEENSSNEWTNEQIKEKITEQREKYSWEFVFTGANVDSFSVANAMGIQHAAAYTCDVAGVANNFGAISRGVSSYRSGRGYDSSEDSSDA